MITRDELDAAYERTRRARVEWGKALRDLEAAQADQRDLTRQYHLEHGRDYA